MRKLVLLVALLGVITLGFSQSSGDMRYNGGNIQYYNGSSWVTISSTSSVDPETFGAATVKGSAEGKYVYTATGGTEAKILVDSLGVWFGHQDISISNDTIYLEDGGFVVLPEDVIINGLTKSNDTIKLGGALTEETDIEAFGDNHFGVLTKDGTIGVGMNQKLGTFLTGAEISVGGVSYNGTNFSSISTSIDTSSGVLEAYIGVGDFAGNKNLQLKPQVDGSGNFKLFKYLRSYGVGGEVYYLDSTASLGTSIIRVQPTSTYSESLFELLDSASSLKLSLTNNAAIFNYDNIRFNTANKGVGKVWTSDADGLGDWQTPPQQSVEEFSSTTSATQTTLNTRDESKPFMVYINGLLLPSSGVTSFTGTTLILASPPIITDIIQVIYWY